MGKSKAMKKTAVAEVKKGASIKKETLLPPVPKKEQPKKKETLLPPETKQSKKEEPKQEESEEEDVEMSSEASTKDNTDYQVEEASNEEEEASDDKEEEASDDKEEASDEEKSDEEMEDGDEFSKIPNNSDEPTKEKNPSIVTDYEKDPYLLKDAAYIKTDTNWKNKQRVLLFSSRGISHQHRHLMEDLKRLMPHHKAESKFEKTQDFSVIREIAELKSCNSVLFFEARKHTDLYMHMSRVPFGPTIKFQVLNIHTSGEVRLSGNCLMYSRPLLTFASEFDDQSHLRLMKEIFIQVFGTPRNHPKSKAFHDHVMSFFYSDSKVWIRHYQISPLTDSDENDPEKQVLTEIGPRFVLAPIWVLDGTFSGKKLYHNPDYLTPVQAKKEAKQTLAIQHKVYKEQEETKKLTKQKLQSALDQMGREEEIFENDDQDDGESSEE